MFLSFFYVCKYSILFIYLNGFFIIKWFFLIKIIEKSMVFFVYFIIFLFFYNFNRKKRGICNIFYEIVGVCIDFVIELIGFIFISMIFFLIFIIFF